MVVMGVVVMMVRIEFTKFYCKKCEDVTDFIQFTLATRFSCWECDYWDDKLTQFTLEKIVYGGNKQKTPDKVTIQGDWVVDWDTTSTTSSS